MREYRFSWKTYANNVKHKTMEPTNRFYRWNLYPPGRCDYDRTLSYSPSRDRVCMSENLETDTTPRRRDRCRQECWSSCQSHRSVSERWDRVSQSRIPEFFRLQCIRATLACGIAAMIICFDKHRSQAAAWSRAHIQSTEGSVSLRSSNISDFSDPWCHWSSNSAQYSSRVPWSASGD